MSKAAIEYSYTTSPSGYRLPADLRLGRVRLQVADLQRSITYYESVVGLRVLQRSPETATLGAAGSEAVLVELNEKAGVAPVPQRGRLGLYHFAILLPDRSALGRFLSHLSEIGQYAGMSDHYVSEAVYLTDPDGLGIEVYADRARASWQIAESTLAMGSAHLDVNDLVRSAGGEKWTGAPAGTTIGHIHLYVNDLAAGEKFYHNAVGFDKVRLDFPGALFMSAGGYHHHLGTNTWAATSPVASDSDARLLEWTAVVGQQRDIEDIGASLRSNGFSAESTNGELVIADPWGSRIRFKTSA